MKETTYLLMGGGVTSLNAAKQLRQHDPTGAITIVAAEPYLPYNRPPLTKEYLLNKQERTGLFFEPAPFYQTNRIDVLTSLTVTKLELPTKRVILSNGQDLFFGKALLATGGRPRLLQLPGADLPGVHYLRTIDDADAIRKHAVSGARVVVIGAGFIGMEIAASLTSIGLKAHVVEVGPYIWNRFLDQATASFYQDYCQQRGITFSTDNVVMAFQGEGRVQAVVLRDGTELPCDLVCVGVGILPNDELAKQAGLAVDNGIVVNQYLQSSHHDIYAGGDVASYHDPVFNKRRRVEHWGHAEYCGMIAGMNMAGKQQSYDLLTYVWSDLFDLHLEFAGDETESDQLLLRGTFDKEAFTVFFLKGGRLRAYLSTNMPDKEFLTYQRLIRRKVDLSGKAAVLKDRNTDLKTLLK
ncbi:MAG: FAD-dependent oxidoreductase [Chloroflexi bacterium]|nr:FAD-dependent oxidoreductase [Chloroflexota bacterium]